MARRLWLPPARIGESRASERRVGPLELFFDLVFVVLVAQLAHHLAAHPTWSGFAWFALLFFIIWSSWLNGTFYHDAHATSDLSIRVFTFAQVIALAMMAGFIGNVPGDGDAGFALAYAVNSVVLAIMWGRTGWHDATHRQGAYPYALAFLVGAVLFAVSALTNGPATYVLWIAAVAVQAAAAVPAVQVLRAEFGTVQVTPSLIERFGTIVILVLGEVVAGAIIALANSPDRTRQVVLVTLLGVIIAIEVWWLYFDLVSQRMRETLTAVAWMYLHIPLIIGIAGAGAGIVTLGEAVGEPLPVAARWLFVGTMGLTLVSVAALTWTIRPAQPGSAADRRVLLALGAAVVLVAGIGLTGLDSVATIAAVVVVLILPMLFSSLVWLRS